MLREVNDSLGKHQKCMVVMGRISQGLEEMEESTAQEGAEVFKRWSAIEEDMARSNKRHIVRQNHLHLQEPACVV